MPPPDEYLYTTTPEYAPSQTAWASPPANAARPHGSSPIPAPPQTVATLPVEGLLPDSDALLEALHHAARCDRRLKSLHWLSRALHFAFLIGLPLCYLLPHLSKRYAWTLLMLPLLISLAGVAASIAIELYLLQQRLKWNRLVFRLTAHAHGLGLPPLLDQGEASDLLCPVCNFVCALLSHIRASDRTRFTHAHTIALLRLLFSPEAPLVLSALQALEQIGDKHAIEPVQRLVSHGRTRRIREAAEQCLLFLAEQVAEQERAKTLLRPSDAISATPDTLLRPAAAGDRKEGQDHLLRPLE